MSERLEKVSNQYGLPLDPRREVWQLSVGERQRIEIVRALMQNPKFLILDEPTAVLTPQEADQLFIVLDRLKAEGRAILYISHKLEEVKRLCDTATILRGGKKVATCNPKAETAASLARMMVGTEIKEVKAAAGRETTVPRLVVNDLNLEPDDPHGVRLKNVSLELKGGDPDQRELEGLSGRERHRPRLGLAPVGPHCDDDFTLRDQTDCSEPAVALLFEKDIGLNASLEDRLGGAVRAEVGFRVIHRDREPLHWTPLLIGRLHEQRRRLVADDLDVLDVLVQGPQPDLPGMHQRTVLRGSVLEGV